MINIASNNDVLEMMETISPDEFKELCLNTSDSQVKEAYGLDLGELYEQAEQALALYIQGDGFPRNEAIKMAKELLYRMTATRVDGVEISISTILGAAGYSPNDFMVQAGLSMSKGHFANLWE